MECCLESPTLFDDLREMILVAYIQQIRAKADSLYPDKIDQAKIITGYKSAEISLNSSLDKHGLSSCLVTEFRKGPSPT